MNKKIKLLISNQFEWIGKELAVLVLANILAAIMVHYIPVYYAFKWIFIACLGYRNFKFISENTIMPSTAQTLNSFTWKYLQGLSLDRRDMVIALTLSSLIICIPFLSFCLVFSSQFNDLFYASPLKPLELIRLFISLIIFLSLFSILSISYVITFPRYQYQKIDFNESFLVSVQVGLYAMVIVMYAYIILRLCIIYGFNFIKVLKFAVDGIGFIFETWMLPVALLIFTIILFRRTIRTWIDEKTSYRKQELYNKKRDNPRMIAALLLIAIPYYTFDFNTPNAYYGHEILKAIYNKDNSTIERYLSDKEALNFRNRFGFNPLMVAAAEGNLEIYKKLENAGASYSNEEVQNDSQRKGMNLLYLAVDSEKLEMIEYILNKNFDPNIKLANRAASPLHFAAKKCNSPTLDLLIKFGGDVNLKRDKNNTPLHNAVKAKCFGEVVLLVEKGADLSIKNDDSKTPVDYAEGEIAYYLKKKVGK